MAWAGSSQVVVNLQPFERLSKMLIGGVLTDFFSPDPGVVTGIQAGTWSATAMTDWDGDLDLFVAHENGLRVFRNIGAARLFLNNGSSVLFSGSGSSNFLGTPAAAGTSIAVGDINQDVLLDVLLADSDGRIWEFLNNGSGGFSLQSKVWGGSYPGFASGLTLAAADLEGDGDLDLIGGLANGGILALRDPSVGRPTGLIARPGANSVQLDWDANWQSRIRGSYVYRSASLDGPWNKLVSDYVPLPSYLDSPVDPAVMNYYYVSGVSYFFLPGNSEPRMVESLPSDPALTQAGKVILSVRPVRGKPGQRIKINLSIENAMGVSGIGMQIHVAYDPAKLQPWAQAQPGGKTVLSTGLSRNLTFTDNGASANGELIIGGSGGSLEPGAGKLFALQFEVADGLPRKTSLGVTISGATMSDLNGNPLAVEILPQAPPERGDTHTEGDLDGDGHVTHEDKDRLKDLIKPKSRPPTDDERMAGDLNGDGRLNEKDHMLHMRLLNGLPIENSP